jgi:deoxyribodipyrimidine photo-lyase
VVSAASRIAIHWFRNDLRLADNRALCEAARAQALVPVFVLDPVLLRASRAASPRVRFLLDCLERLARELERRGSQLLVRRGDPAREIPRLAREVRADCVCWNRDVTPYARARDARVRAALARCGIAAVECKDRWIQDPADVCKPDGTAYSVYGPYRRAWRRRLAADPPPALRAPRLPPFPRGPTGLVMPAAAELGHGADATALPTGGERAALRRLAGFLSGPARDYAHLRDLPALDGTSRLSPYLRFGAISARTCLEQARELARADARARAGAERWIDELAWRDFYAAVLRAHPRVLHAAFRAQFDALEWDGRPEWFAAWCEGRTGFPLVDAGMRQLAATGWMHNRVRMVTASFLVKDLGIDWRRGEAHFFARLVDGDPASNNGGWQWSAGTGTDAQPFFRILNPDLQARRFDPDGVYVRRWVPELRALAGHRAHRPPPDAAARAGYPPPIVDHAQRRARALERWRALSGEGTA